MTPISAGLVALRFPAATPVALTALAWLAALGVALLLALSLCAIAGCMLSSRITLAEESQARDATGFDAVPIAAPPEPPALPIASATATRQLFVLTPGELTVPLNPFGPSRPDMRILE